MLKLIKKEPDKKVISLHCIETGRRLTRKRQWQQDRYKDGPVAANQLANPKDVKFLTYNSWRTKWAG